MIITYDPENGIVVPDNKVSQYLIDNKNKDIRVGSDLMIDTARLLHAQNLIEVQYFYFNGIISITKSGGLDHYPSGFCSKYTEVLHDLMLERKKK